MPFDDKQLPSAEHLAELLAKRRTIREFKNQKLDRALLEEIVDFGVYAPTHNFELRTIIVDDERLIEAMDAAVFRFSRRIYHWIYRNPLMGWLARLSGLAMRKEFVKAKPKLKHSLELGRAYKSRPPVVILIVGDEGTTLTRKRPICSLYDKSLRYDEECCLSEPRRKPDDP